MSKKRRTFTDKFKAKVALDAVASLRPRPSGPPLRGRAPQSDGIINRRLFAAGDTNRTDADSTLNSLDRDLRLGVGAFVWMVCHVLDCLQVNSYLPAPTFITALPFSILRNVT